MNHVDKEIHGYRPMGELESWLRSKCCCLNEDGICSEHGSPTDRLEDMDVQTPDPERDARIIISEENALRGIK